jgi:hypothetical protein
MAESGRMHHKAEEEAASGANGDDDNRRGAGRARQTSRSTYLRATTSSAHRQAP